MSNMQANDALKNINKPLWAVHAPDDAPFLDKNIISLDLAGLGDLSGLPADKEIFKARYDESYPERNPVERASGANLIYRLAHELNIGDYVMFQRGSVINLGVIAGGYEFDAASGCHQRRVEWKNGLPSNGFSRAALREANASPLALSPVRRYTGEFFAAWNVPYLETPETSGQTVKRAPEISERADFTRNPEILIPVWKPDNHTRPCTLDELNQAFENARDFPEFLANILQTMGYQVSAAACAPR